MLALMLILYTRYMSRQTTIYITTEHPDDFVFLWCSFKNKEQNCNVYLLMSSRSRYSGFLQEFLHPSCDWIQGLKALIYSFFFLITSQRSCNNCVHFDILTNGSHFCTTGTFMVLGRAFFVLDKYENSVGIFVKFPLLRQLDQLRFFQLAISWITVGHLF